MRGGRAWQRAGAPLVPVAVSIAAGQITDHAFVGEVRDTLLAAGLERGMLELDVTEDVLLYDSARSARTLTALKSLGVAIAIEAFGTGKASFADLQRFPIDALKLHARASKASRSISTSSATPKASSRSAGRSA